MQGTVIASRGNSKCAGAATPQLLPLAKARICMASEFDANDQLNEALVKNITGRDPIKVRGLHENEKEIQPQAKIFVQTNHLFKFSGGDEWRRRISVTCFNTVFGDGPGETPRNPAMIDKLKGPESWQILTWVLIGAIEWVQGGKKVFAAPPAFEKAKRDFFNDDDVVGSYLANYTTPDSKAKIPRSDLCEHFQNHSEDASSINQREFHSKLIGRGRAFSRDQINLVALNYSPFI